MKQILIENDYEGFPITALREIKILKRLDNEYVVKLIEVVNSKPEEYDENKTDFFLIFEYCKFDLCGMLEFCNLEHIPVKPEYVKSLVLQLFLGLKYLHASNIVHRDLKLSNLLINSYGTLKLADFGLARYLRSELEENYTYKVVTLWYRAPELLLGQRKYKFEIDMWSAGCIIAEICLGYPLFHEDNEEKLFAKLQKTLGDLKQYWPDISKLSFYNKFIREAGTAQNSSYSNPNNSSNMGNTNINDNQDSSNAIKIKFAEKLRNHLKNIQNNSKHLRCPINDTCFDLIQKCLQIDPKERITAEQAINHPWFTESPAHNIQDMPKIKNEMHEYELKKKKEREKSMSMYNNNKFGQQQQNFKNFQSQGGLRKPPNSNYNHNLSNNHHSMNGSNQVNNMNNMNNTYVHPNNHNMPNHQVSNNTNFGANPYQSTNMTMNNVHLNATANFNPNPHSTININPYINERTETNNNNSNNINSVLNSNHNPYASNSTDRKYSDSTLKRKREENEYK